MKLNRISALSVVVCVILALLLLASCALPNASPAPPPSPTASASVPDLPSLSSVVNMVMPSVVYIFMTSKPDSKLAGASASGSGVIMRSDGYILTNKHVVDGAQTIEVTLQNDRVYDVAGVWTDDIMDLAVVKISGKFTPAQFADPWTTAVGDWVVAIGHALGMSPAEGGATVTTGIISNLNRSFSIDQAQYYDIIQTDAAINPGNSGGPLVNLSGEVIGINSAIAAGQGIGYAINAATAQHVFQDLVQYGKAYHPYLGVSVEDVTPAVASKRSLSQRTGAVITQVEPRGPAASAGLQQDDVIVSFNGGDIRLAADLVRQLWRLEPGDSITLRVRRGNIYIDKTIVLPERPSSASPLVDIAMPLSVGFARAPFL